MTTTPASTADANASPALRSEVRLQAYQFGNFFQASDPALEEDVHALGAEYRAYYRPWKTPTDFYGQVNLLHYTDIDRPNGIGARVGARHEGAVHYFDVFVDHTANRAAFEVGDTTNTADVTTLSGEYMYRLAKDWQIGAEGVHEKQSYDTATDHSNTYNAFGGSIRYRGFGSIFRPEVGYVSGSRDVENHNESYDEDYWFAQVVSMPAPRWYLSLRFRDRTRDYTTPTVTSSNFRRSDKRGQWTALANFRATDHLQPWVYASTESVNTSLAGRDFDTNYVLLGLTISF